MTNRENLLALLSDRTPELQVDHAHILRETFGCFQISAEECGAHESCDECWHSWLEKEVTTNDH